MKKIETNIMVIPKDAERRYEKEKTLGIHPLEITSFGELFLLVSSLSFNLWEFL